MSKRNPSKELELYRRRELAAMERESDRDAGTSGALARGAFKLVGGTIKLPFKVAWGVTKFGMEASKNTPAGHMRKVIGLTAVGAVAWVGINDHEPPTDRHNTIQVATVEIGTPTSMFGEKAAEAKNMIRHGVNEITFHHLFDDNRRLTEVADWLSEDRGYYIPAERLVALNKNSKLIQRDSNGEVMDELKVDPGKGASWQVEVPGPIYKGYHVIDDENETLATISDSTKVAMSTLRAWNPQLARYGNDAKLPEGALVQVEPTIDRRLVLRKMTDSEGSMRNLLQKYHALQADIVLANGSIIGSGSYAPDSPGSLGYFPLVGGEEKKNKQHWVAAQINAAFSPSGAPLDVSDSQISGKKPPKKPKGNQKTLPTKPAPIEDNKGHNHISINTDGLKPDQASIAQTIVDTAYNLNISDSDRYRAAVIGLITARVESNIHNMKGGDRDSVGVMQQRGGWGTYAQRHNVQWAVNAFYNGGSSARDHYSEPGLLDIKNWQRMSYGDAAQKVQVSAFPDRYAQHVDEAKKILRG